jgi:hypothetical protein
LYFKLFATSEYKPGRSENDLEKLTLSWRPSAIDPWIELYNIAGTNAKELTIDLETLVGTTTGTPTLLALPLGNIDFQASITDNGGTTGNKLTTTQILSYNIIKSKKYTWNFKAKTYPPTTNAITPQEAAMRAFFKDNEKTSFDKEIYSKR